MKTQTYISRLIDKNGNTLNFERWSYKKLSTILQKNKWLYINYKWAYKDRLEKAVYFTVDSTSPQNDNYIEVYRENINTFLEVI